MKLKIITIDSIRDFADFIITVNENDSAESEEDFITEMLALRTTRQEAITCFTEAIMVYATYTKFCLLNEEYELAEKLKEVIDIELKNTIALLDAINQLWEEDEKLLIQIINEVNYINNQNLY
jgi:hypothetical protein